MFDLSPPVPGDVLLKPGEVAKITQLSTRTLADRRWRGKEPAYVKLSPGRNGHVRYWRSTVNKWLTNHAAGTTS